MEFIFRLGSFSVLAQTLLHFTENKTYDKYIRILCNIIVLSLVVLPVMEIFRGDTSVQVGQLIHFYEEQLLDNEEKNKELQETKENQIRQSMRNKEEDEIHWGIQNEIQRETEKEIKYKLNNSELASKGYEVKKVVITGMREDGTWDTEVFSLQIELIKSDSKTEEKEIKTPIALAELCAEVLETNKEYVEVNISE